MEIYLYFIVVLIPLIIGITRFFRLGGSGKVLTIQLLLTFIFISISAFLKYRGQNRMLVYHIQTPIDYIFYSTILYFGFASKYIKNLIIISIIIFIPISILLSIYVNNISENNSFSYLISYFLLVVWALLYLNITIHHLSVINIFSDINFWVSIGYLCYFSSSILMEVFYNLMQSISIDYANKIYFLTYPLAYLLHICFTIGLLSDIIFIKVKELNVK